MQSILQRRHLRLVARLQIEEDRLKVRHQSDTDNHFYLPHEGVSETEQHGEPHPPPPEEALARNIGLVKVEDERTDHERQNDSPLPPSESLENQTEKYVVHPGVNENCINAKNWPDYQRYCTGAIIWLMVFALGWASTCDSNTLTPAAEELHVSEEAETLATAMFFWGIAFGSLVSGPISETVGRNPVYLTTFAVSLGFSAASAVVPNFAAQLVVRFLTGLASSPTLSMYGGSLADLCTPVERRLAWPIFASAPVLGPVLAPFASAWMMEYIDWRWVYWVSLIFSGVTFVIALFCLPETFAPVLEMWKVQHLRTITGDTRYVASLEASESLSVRLKASFLRPTKFFTTEPIIILLGLYLIIIYTVNFTFLNGFSTIFGTTYNLPSGISALAFLSITAGALFNIALTPLYKLLHAHLARRAIKTPDSEDPTCPAGPPREPPPELHLVPAAIAAPFMTLSLFWLGWTNYPSISPLSGYFAAGVFGYALTAIFIASYQYIIDSYDIYASSALASLTMLRYLAGGGMLVVSRPMYERLGVQWTMTLLGGLAAVMVPVPVWLWMYGKRVRGRSAFALKE